MFLIACGNAAPPEGAKEISDPVYEIIEADLDRLELQTPLVKGLLDKADPLPDMKGKVHENNDHMIELADSVLTDGRWYFENDRFLIANPNDIDMQSIDELSPGIRSGKKITDNYVVVLHNEETDGEFSSRHTGDYIHEFFRFYYPIDNVFVGEDMLLEYDSTVNELMQRLYRIDDEDSLTETLAEGFDGKMSYLRESADAYSAGEETESGNPPETVAKNVKEIYEDIQWNLDMSEEDIATARLWRYDDVTSSLVGLGVTKDEYEEELLKHPELMGIDKEELRELQGEIQELYPSIDFKTGEGGEAQQETREERREGRLR